MLSSLSKLMFANNHIKEHQRRNISPPSSIKKHSHFPDYDLWVPDQWQIQSGLLKSKNTFRCFTGFDVEEGKRVGGINKSPLLSRQMLVYGNRRKKISLKFSGSHAASLSPVASEHELNFASLSHHDSAIFFLSLQFVSLNNWYQLVELRLI